MTGEHVQDLLLDLAYGELPLERVAEVEAHLASCDACRAERDDLQRTRALLEPLRALEEPRPGFDDRILQSARAEAGLQADGTPGPTIEVKGSVKPLGLQAARVDPLAEGVRVARKETSRRSVWLKRAVVGASIAGAAGVALVVGTSVRQTARDRSTEVAAIQFRAPVVQSPEARPPASPPEVARRDQADAPQGSGGDLGKVPLAVPVPRRAQEPGKTAPPAPPQGQSVARSKAAAPQPTPMAPARDATAAAPAPPPPAVDVSKANRSDSSQAEVKTAPPAASESDGFAAVAGGTVSAEGPSQSPLPESALKKEKPDPDRLEESAGEARRSGQYARAAELYQLAAGARRSANDSSRAAWDLAHAVECLAAASKLTEAGGVRAELLRSYPAEQGPLHAADRALGYPVKAPR